MFHSITVGIPDLVPFRECVDLSSYQRQRYSFQRQQEMLYIGIGLLLRFPLSKDMEEIRQCWYDETAALATVIEKQQGEFR
jgi:hypothetical protein